VHIQLSEYLCCIQKVLVLEDLLAVEYQERQVEDQCQPIAVDKEEERQESLDGGFGYNVGVEAVAEIDRVNVVTF